MSFPGTILANKGVDSGSESQFSVLEGGKILEADALMKLMFHEFVFSFGIERRSDILSL